MVNSCIKRYYSMQNELEEKHALLCVDKISFLEGHDNYSPTDVFRQFSTVSCQNLR